MQKSHVSCIDTMSTIRSSQGDYSPCSHLVSIRYYISHAPAGACTSGLRGRQISLHVCVLETTTRGLYADHDDLDSKGFVTLDLQAQW